MERVYFHSYDVIWAYSIESEKYYTHAVRNSANFDIKYEHFARGTGWKKRKKRTKGGIRKEKRNEVRCNAYRNEKGKKQHRDRWFLSVRIKEKRAR